MLNNTMIFIAILFALSACGPDQKGSLIKDSEQMAHEDSVKREVETKLLQAQKLALQDSIQRIENEISSVKNEIGTAKADFQVQTDNLTRIKKFKLLRSKEEREAQIRAQSDVLFKTETRISELEHQLVNLEVLLDNLKMEFRNHSGK